MSETKKRDTSDVYQKSSKALEQYMIICTLKPLFKSSKYPYNPWTTVKIEATMNQLKLYNDGRGVFHVEPHVHKKTVGGGGAKIIVLVCDK